MKKNKLVTGAIMAMLVAPMVLGTYGSVADASSIKDMEMVEVPQENTVVDEKYEVVAEFIKGKTTSKYFGVKPVVDNYGSEIILNPADNLKGKIGKVWENVGMVKGKQLDMKWTIMDWKKAGYKGGEYIRLGSTDVSVTTGGLGYNADLGEQMAGVTIKGEFIDHETGKLSEDVKGNFMNFLDIDARQGVVFDAETTKKIEKIFVTEDTWIDGELLEDGRLAVKEVANKDSDATDEFAMFTTLFNGNSFTFDWVKDYSGYNKNKEIDWKTSQFSQYLGYSSKKLARTEVPSPTKLVDGEEANSIVNYLQHFTYDITHRVPNEKEQFYYKDYTLSDNVVPELDINSVKVTDETGADVSSYFKDETKDNALKYVATPEALKDPKFYGHDYKFTLDVSVKKGADLSKYADKDGNIKLPNTAKVVVNGEEKPTEEVITEVPPLVVNKQHKSILDKDGKEVDVVSLQKGDIATFKLDFDVANDKEIVSFSDDLESVLDLVEDSYKVLDKDGNDITDQFDIAVDGDKESIVVTPKDPMSLSGKSISIYVSGAVKDEALDKYFNDKGVALIPNTGFAHYKDSDEPTNEVIVEVPAIVEGTQHKSIIDADGKETDLASVKEGDEVTFKGDFEIATDKTLLNLTDKMADVLDLNEKDYKITDTETGDDISDQFEVAMDGEKETNVLTPKDPEKLKGKKVTVILKATVKKDADFTDYLDKDGNIMIPNIWLANYDSGEQPSNEVHVTVPQDKPGVIQQTGGNNFVDTALALTTAGIVGLGASLVSIKRKEKQANETK